MDAFILTLAPLVLSAAALGVSLWAHRKSPTALQSDVRQLGLDVAELYDKVEHWMKRERVRKLRDGQDTAALAAGAGSSLQLDLVDHRASKARLREQVFGGR